MPPLQRTVASGVSLGLALLVFTVYASLGEHEHIGFGDPALVWQPLAGLSQALDTSLLGDASSNAGLHLYAGAGLHAASAVLLLLALYAASGALWPSALVAALFAVHPLRVESVAWPAQRGDVLSALFLASTLFLYVGWVRRSGVARYVGVALSLTLGLLASPTLAILPLLLVVLDVWPLRRWRGLDGDRTLGRLLYEKLPLLALSCAAAVAALVAALAARGEASAAVPVAWRLVNAPLAAAWTLWKSVWPTDLGFFYPHPGTLSGVELGSLVLPALGATALLAAASGAAVLARRRLPYLLTGWAWFLLCLIPTLGLGVPALGTHADPHASLPLVGLGIALAFGLRDLALRWPRVRSEVAGGALLAVGVLAIASADQLTTWRTPESVYEQGLVASPQSYRAHAGLAALDFEADRLDDARLHYERALELRPDQPRVHNDLGGILLAQGFAPQAIDHFQRTLELEPSHAGAHSNLGNAYMSFGDFRRSRRHFERAVELQPDAAWTHNNLGNLLGSGGKLVEARLAFERAVRLDPEFAAAHYNLGRITEQQRRFAIATTHYRRALEIDPDYAAARDGLRRVRRASRQ